VIRAPQPFEFSFADSLVAEAGGVPQAALHTDVDAICHAFDAVRPIAARLGVEPPLPGLAGLAYVHVSTLGAPVIIEPDAPEPRITPCISSAEEIDLLEEPRDYLSCPLVSERLRLVEKLRERRPRVRTSIGHDFEGPVTTAVLLMGQGFFLLPYEDAARAHRLLAFCVRSALNYCHALHEHTGQAFSPGPRWLPDDFAGIFPPDKFRQLVLPAWNMMYQGLSATWRSLHSELLREEHMPLLLEAQIGSYDPGVDQYLPPEVLKRSCPALFTLRIRPGDVRALSAPELVEMYEHYAGFGPREITFSLESLADEQKIAALLEVARRLARAG
jgi:hypothetical protein